MATQYSDLNAPRASDKSSKKLSAVLMAHELCIHPCICTPPHGLHPPPVTKPLRIQIQGPLETIQKLLPDAPWHEIVPFPQPGGIELATLTHQTLYGQAGLSMVNGTPVVRDEYLAWAMQGRRALDYIDYYGVTFDHLVPHNDPNPEVLVINIIELEKNDGIYGDGGIFANEVLSFSVDPTEYTGKKVLAVPRCCQRKKGTQDRKLINSCVAERESQIVTISPPTDCAK